MKKDKDIQLPQPLLEIWYERYAEVLQRLAGYKRRGGVWKHLFSQPYRWLRDEYKRRIIRDYRNESYLPCLSGENDLIVSLTSFPPRIGGVHLVLRSILRQTVLPGKIILWLSEDEFPQGLTELPGELRQLVNKGVEIRFVKGNLRSYKKFFYAFREFPDSRIVTIDDDLIYPVYTLERLVKLSARYPAAVCANIVRRIVMKNGQFAPYRQWNKADSTGVDECSLEYVAIGCGGILYPPHWYDDVLFNVDFINRYCPFADDLWLKANEMRSCVSVAVEHLFFPHPIALPGTERSSLHKKNNGRVNMNDKQWQELEKLWRLSSYLIRKG